MPVAPDTQWNTAQADLAAGNLADAAVQFKALVLGGYRPVASLLALSHIAQRQDRFRETLAAARSAAGMVGTLQRWEALAQVAHRLLTLGDAARAGELIDAADWSHPHVLAHAAGLVQYLGLAGRHDAALARSEGALAHRPDDAGLHYARAVALRHLGRTDAAFDALERCIALDPSHAQAHWTLAYLRRSTPAGARIGRIERVARQLSDETDDLCLLDYALFKEYDDAGDTTQAWAALERGAARKRASLRHSDADDDALDTALRRAFTHAPESGGAIAAHRPIFIVGMPRTGTTVLERMLGRHPQVASAGELNDLPIQVCWEADRFVHGSIDARLVAQADSIDATHLGHAYLERTAAHAAGKACVIDKLPANLRNVGFVLRALPQARVLCLQREAMDACFSNLKELFSGSNYAYSYTLPELAAEYLRCERLVAHWCALAPRRVLRVDYEALVRDPEPQARRVLAFCDLPWNPACVDIAGNTAPSATASSTQVREPIHDRNVGAWRRYAGQLAPLRDLLQR